MNYWDELDKRLKLVENHPKLRKMFNEYGGVTSQLSLSMHYSKLFTEEETNEVMDLFNKIWDKKAEEVLSCQWQYT